MRSSPVVRSPLTVNTIYETRVTSPVTSPLPKISSDIYSSSALDSVNLLSKVNSENYRVTQNSYKSSINQSSSLLSRGSPMMSTSNVNESIDYSSNVSPLKIGASRRDSWDVLKKTKHMLSNNSLESLANLTDKQLDTNLSYDRSTVDNETHTNTQYNKFLLSDSSYKERSEKSVLKTSSNDYGYNSFSKFVPIEDDIEGAKAIKVTNKPDGYLGQPFEFESMFYIKSFISFNKNATFS